jgi:hypothetical protein
LRQFPQDEPEQTEKKPLHAEQRYQIDVTVV